MTFLRRLEPESGSALPAVIGVMLVIGMLAAVIQSTSTQVRGRTTHERAEKRAFQAAEAGLNVARYRLNKASPAPDAEECFTTVPVDPGAGDCAPSAVESLGNGAEYRYTITDVLEAGDTECDTDGLDFADRDYRCITSIGTANNATRRVQALVSAPLLPMFPVEGIFALGSLSIGPGTLTGGIGSNTSVSSGAGGSYTVTLGPGGTYSGSRPRTTLPQAYTAPVNDAAFEATDDVGENNNAAFPAAVNQWREVSVANNLGPVTVPPGTYNFCDVSFGGATRLRSAGPEPVRIFVDSPERTSGNGSGCRNNRGSFVANNMFEFTTTTTPANPALIEIQMYGDPTAPYASDFWLKNASEFHGTLYAPRTAFRIDNASTVIGAIVARTVAIQNNFHLTGVAPLGLTAGGQVFESSAWTECVRTGSSATAAGAGC